jgi:hypothetical protein
MVMLWNSVFLLGSWGCPVLLFWVALKAHFGLTVSFTLLHLQEGGFEIRPSHNPEARVYRFASPTASLAYRDK